MGTVYKRQSLPLMLYIVYSSFNQDYNVVGHMVTEVFNGCFGSCVTVLLTEIFCSQSHGHRTFFGRSHRVME